MKKMFRLAWNNLLHNPLNTFLCWISLSISTGIIAVVLILQHNTERQVIKNVEGVDLVIGAKGSPLQLILSAIFHSDVPTGNISFKEVTHWMNHPYVEKAIPLAYGDNYKGYAIVGSTEDLLKHYGATVYAGQIFAGSFEVVVGSEVVRKMKIGIGDRFFSAHGKDGNGEEHREHAYTVRGVLKKTGTILDQLIISDIESIRKIHQEDPHHKRGDEEVTAVLLKFRNPMGKVQLPRMINEQTSMMAAVPVIEINRLFSLMGNGAAVLKKVGWSIMLLSGLGIFVNLYNALKNRRAELALLRAIGIARYHILLSLLLEALLLTISGILGGLILSRIGLWIYVMLQQNEPYWYVNNLWSPVPGEFLLIIGAFFTGLLAAIVPAIKVWKLDISKTLANG